MRLTRIYLNQPIELGSEYLLDPDASGHLLRVLRLKKGDALKIFNGKGEEYLAKMIDTTKKNAIILILESIPSISESPLFIHLGQSISRGEKMDYSLQKSVELGVKKITPLVTERSGVKLLADRLDKKILHWEKVIISACEQCGRSFLPELMPIQSLSDWLTHCTEDMRFVLAPSGEHHLNKCELQDTNIALLIGPEGGLSPSEIEMAGEFSFLPLQLGPRILRTETAAPAAIAVLQALWGDMG